jgi:hypothetical protein
MRPEASISSIPTRRDGCEDRSTPAVSLWGSRAVRPIKLARVPSSPRFASLRPMVADGRSEGVAVKLYLDESGNNTEDSAVLIVGAVEPLGDAAAVEQSIRALWQDLAKRRSLEGHRGFERFKMDGFHAAYDPPEIASTFIEFLKDVPFRTYMYMTDRSSIKAGPSDLDKLKFLYTNLLADILLRFKSESVLECFFETNEELKSFYGTTPERAVQCAREKGAGQSATPKMITNVVRKADLMSMAIIDYVMVAVQRWTTAGRPTSGREWPLRAFREIEPTISILYSIEEGPISSRSQPLH